MSSASVFVDARSSPLWTEATALFIEHTQRALAQCLLMRHSAQSTDPLTCAVSPAQIAQSSARFSRRKRQRVPARSSKFNAALERVRFASRAAARARRARPARAAR
jgi:hypothetical protein